MAQTAYGHAPALAVSHVLLPTFGNGEATERASQRIAIGRVATIGLDVLPESARSCWLADRQGEGRHYARPHPADEVAFGELDVRKEREATTGRLLTLTTASGNDLAL